MEMHLATVDGLTFERYFCSVCAVSPAYFTTDELMAHTTAVHPQPSPDLALAESRALDENSGRIASCNRLRAHDTAHARYL